MIKTVIVDDDVEMLDWMKKIIDWESYGFQIAAVAGDGREALELCKRDMPDLVITDIAMPVMDGLELIHEIRTLRQDVKCVFLTCHEDFNYALKALQLQAEDYIVKYTLTGAGLAELLCRLQASFEGANSAKEEIYLLSRELSSSRTVIEEKFITDIAQQVITERENIFRRASTLKIRLPEGSFRVMATYVDNYTRSMEKSSIKEHNPFKSQVLNIFEDTFKQDCGLKSFAFGPGRFITLYWDNTGQVPLKQMLSDKITACHASIFNTLNVRVSTCISSVIGSYSALGRALEECSSLRDGYFYEGGGQIISEKRIYAENNAASVYDEFLTEFLPAVEVLDKPSIRQSLEWLYTRLHRGGFSPACARSVYKMVRAELESAASKKGFSLGEAAANTDTFSEMQKDLNSLAEAYLSLSAMQGPCTSRKEINTVLKYIDANISEKITCEMMALMVNMNGSYFSRLFKNETGMSFSDYLIGKRIEKATSLLKYSDMKIEDITKAIGLEQPSYFHKLYRKVTGKTPGEVREKAASLIKIMHWK